MEVRTAPPRAVTWLAAVPGNPWFAYGSITVLVLHVLWSVGTNGDLVFGDTAFHVDAARSWLAGEPVGAGSSPAYIVFVAGSLRLLGDIPGAVIGHRVALVLVAAVVVLAIGRRVLPAWAAWFVAAWWVHLPAVHDTLYAIHLAGALGGLVAVYVALGRPSRSQRAATLAVIVVASVLLRFELIVAAVPVAAVCWWVDGRGARPRPAEWYRRPYVAAAVVSLLTVVGTLVVIRSTPGEAVAALRDYHDFSLCGHYAFTFYERGELTGNPFAECHAVMRRDFGTEQPSLLGAAVASPGALARHIGRNGAHVPASMQMTLFGAPSGSYNPDVVPRRTDDPLALVLTVAVVALVGAALALRRRAGVQLRWAQRGPALVMAAAVGVAFSLSLLTLRPRPSYALAPAALVLVAVGAAATVVARALRVERWLAAATLPIALVLLVAVPPYREPAPRPNLATFRAVESHVDLFARPGAVVVGTWQVGGACTYLVAAEGCGLREWPSILDTGATGTTTAAGIAAAVDDVGATVVFADGHEMTRPGMTDFLAAAPGQGWTVEATRPGTAPESYVLLSRAAAP